MTRVLRLDEAQYAVLLKRREKNAQRISGSRRFGGSYVLQDDNEARIHNEPQNHRNQGVLPSMRGVSAKRGKGLHGKGVPAVDAPPVPKRPKRGGGISEGEACLAFQLVWVPGWEREYRFAPPRRFRFDFAFPARKLGVEIEGAIWSKGRHSRPSGVLGDMEKYNEATKLGWAVLRFDTDQAKNGYAYQTIMEFLK